MRRSGSHRGGLRAARGSTCGRIGLGAQVVGIERLAAGHHGPQDARVLVRQRHNRLLPSRALAQGKYPFRYPVAAALGGHHRRLRALDQQRAQVRVASLGAYFTPSRTPISRDRGQHFTSRRTPFHADRGQRFSVMADSGNTRE